MRCGVETASANALGPDGCCAPCLSQPPTYDRVLSFSRYDGELRRLIHLLKYDRMRPLAEPLGERLGRLDLGPGSADLVVAAPLHWRRRRERGFNQAELLARRAALAWGLPFDAKGLRRTKATPPQAGLTRAERLVNVRGAFLAPRRVAIQGRRIVLIDDVMTTGATLDACARALKRAGAASVTAVTLARASAEGSWSG